MRKIKILIADDELEYLDDIVKAMGILGYEVSKASTGMMALELVEKIKPDVVLCDYKMSDIDGKDIVLKIKSTHSDIICIVLTAYFDEDLQQIFKDAGADKLIFKPVSFMEIDQVIKDALDKNSRRG